MKSAQLNRANGLVAAQTNLSRRSLIRLMGGAALSPAILFCAGCGSDATSSSGAASTQGLDTSRFLVATGDEPDTVDFQCTTIFYTIATNVFDRLVEMEFIDDGTVVVVPALAESWEESADGLTYTFHLRGGVTFSNGSPLTSS